MSDRVMFEADHILKWWMGSEGGGVQDHAP